MVGNSPDPQGERLLLRHQPRGGDVEGSGQDFKFLARSPIAYHDFLHILRTGRGTGTATFEDKLLHQLAALRKEVLYVIFMYLHKAYDALERYRCLEIM